MGPVYCGVVSLLKGKEAWEPSENVLRGPRQLFGERVRVTLALGGFFFLSFHLCPENLRIVKEERVSGRRVTVRLLDRRGTCLLLFSWLVSVLRYSAASGAPVHVNTNMLRQQEIYNTFQEFGVM